MGARRKRGVDTPTLADIARRAGVPPGNVFSHFKKRDDLVDAVVTARADGIKEVLRGLDAIGSRRDRLHALTELWVDNAADIARSGCPIGTLCSELTKRSEPDRTGAPLLSMTIEWATEQFRSLDHPDPAGLATTMIAIVQDAALIASTFQNPDVLIEPPWVGNQ